MRLSSVRVGDIIEADIRGFTFLARVEELGPRGLQIRPLCKGISYRRVSARQVTAHWRRSRAVA